MRRIDLFLGRIAGPLLAAIGLFFIACADSPTRFDDIGGDIGEWMIVPLADLDCGDYGDPCEIDGIDVCQFSGCNDGGSGAPSGWPPPPPPSPPRGGDDGGGGGGGGGDGGNENCAWSGTGPDEDCAEVKDYVCPKHVETTDGGLMVKYRERVKSPSGSWMYNEWDWHTFGEMHYMGSAGGGGFLMPPNGWYTIPRGPWNPEPGSHTMTKTLWTGEVKLGCMFEKNTGVEGGYKEGGRYLIRPWQTRNMDTTG